MTQRLPGPDLFLSDSGSNQMLRKSTCVFLQRLRRLWNLKIRASALSFSRLTANHRVDLLKWMQPKQSVGIFFFLQVYKNITQYILILNWGSNALLCPKKKKKRKTGTPSSEQEIPPVCFTESTHERMLAESQQQKVEGFDRFPSVCFSGWR